MSPVVATFSRIVLLWKVGIIIDGTIHKVTKDIVKTLNYISRVQYQHLVLNINLPTQRFGGVMSVQLEADWQICPPEWL